MANAAWLVIAVLISGAACEQEPSLNDIQELLSLEDGLEVEVPVEVVKDTAVNDLGEAATQTPPPPPATATLLKAEVTAEFRLSNRMVSRRNKSNLATSEVEKAETYDDNAVNCLTRLDLKAIDSLSMIGNDGSGLIENKHDNFVESLQRLIGTIGGSNGGNESEDDEDGTTIGQILSDLPSNIKLPAWLSKSYDYLKNEKLNSGLKNDSLDDHMHHLQEIESSAKKFEIAQKQAVILQEKFQIRESTEDESLRKRRQFTLAEPEDLPFANRIKELIQSNDGPNDGGLGDEEMVMEDMNTESLAAMKCPITQKPIERAARANCPHYFDYAACMEMFRNKSWLKCFTPGCPHERQGVRFQKSDVKIDEAMTKKIHAARKRLDKEKRRGLR